MHIFLADLPNPLGGANQERGETALLFRRYGVDVTCLHFPSCHCGGETQQLTDDNPWIKRMEEAGIGLVGGESGKMSEVPGLPGSIILGMCCQHVLHNWPELHGLGCRLVWSPAMNFTRPVETEAFRVCPPTAVHFQSQYQFDEISGEYSDWGCKEFVRAYGAFEPLRHLSLDREPEGPFVIGRLARKCRTKWTPHLWRMLSAVRERVPIRALCQGWDEHLTAHCGEPPDWAECLAPNTISAQDFLSRCHALICPNWSVQENWPRVGLEAMSVGVPLVVDDAGGWEEMLGPAGIRCQTLGDYVPALVRLATDEDYRQHVIAGQLARVRYLGNPDQIWRAWRMLFERI